MSAHPFRRFALLLLILLSVMYFRCKPAPPTTTTETTVTTTTTTAPPPANVPANPKRYKPEISVDGAKLSAIPKVSVIWDFEPKNPNGPPPFDKDTGKPVKITWKATDPNFNLLVTFNGKCSVIEEPDCKSQRGTCTAKAKEVFENVLCTFEIKNGDNLAKKDQEGDIVVMPCCQ